MKYVHIRRKIALIIIFIMMIGQYAGVVKSLADEIPNSEYVDSNSYMTKHILKEGGSVIGNNLVDPAGEFSVRIEFSFDGDSLLNNLSYYYKLPEHIAIKGDDVPSKTKPGDLRDTSENKIGTYYISNNIIYYTFDSVSQNKTAYFELGASWDNVENIGSIILNWNDGDQVVKFESAYVSVAKKQENFYIDENGHTIRKFIITVSPKDNYNNQDINEITIIDTFSALKKGYSFGKDLDTANPNQDVLVKKYNSSDELQESKWYDDSEINLKVEGVGNGFETNINFSIDGLSVLAGGKTEIEYYIEISSDMKLKNDASSYSTVYANSVEVNQNIYNESTKTTETLFTKTSVTGSYSSNSVWLYKEEGSATKIEETGKNSVPYTISVNRNRNYSLGGSIVKDEISRFLGGAVVYDTDNQPYIEKIKGWDAKETDNKNENYEYLNWIVLDYKDYSTMEKLASTSEKTAVENLLEQEDYSSLRNTILKAINKKSNKSYTKLTSNIIGQYVFTFLPSSEIDETPNFLWLVPLDEDGIPTAYFLHYNVLSDEQVASLTNGATMWYTEFEAAGKGSSGYPTFVGDKVLNISKYNNGVYRKADGGFYVDWTVSLKVPENSGGFEQIVLYDSLPSYSNVPIGDSGNTYTVYDWLYGFNKGDFSLSQCMYDDGTYNYSFCEYVQNTIFSKMFSISSNSKDENVQKVVNWITTGFSNDNWRRYSSKEINENYKESNKEDVIPYYNGGSGISYTGEATGAGQFIDDKSNLSEMTTYTMKKLYFYIGDLPATTEGYSIDIKYTTQVNPELINSLSKILNRDNLEYVTLKNTIGANQACFEKNGNLSNYIVSPGVARIATASASYWIGTKDIEPTIEKEGKYDLENNVINYTVDLNPQKNVSAESTIYTLKDTLSISGIKYITDSFTLYDENNDIVYTTDPSKKISNKYKDKANISISNKSNENSSFVLKFDNSNNIFLDKIGNLKKLKLEYSVDASNIPEGVTLQNVATWFTPKTSEDTGETTENILGTVMVDILPDQAIEKKMTNIPNLENKYNASFDIKVNLDSQYADEYLKGLNAGDTFIVRDTFESGLLLDIDSIGVFKYNEQQEKYEKLRNGYTLKYNSKTKELEIKINVIEGIDKYLIRYNATVCGTPNKYATVKNNAKIENSTVNEAVWDTKIFKQFYKAGATTSDMSIKIYKYDEENLENRLSNAEFELYEYDGSSWVNITTKDNGCDVLTSDSDGKIEITNKLSNSKLFVRNETWYKLEETKSPAGYMLSSDPIYYYVTDLSGKYPTSIPEGINDYLVADQEENIITIGNKKNQLGIRKVDATEGNNLEGAVFEIYSDKQCNNLIDTSTEKGNGLYVFESLVGVNGNSTLYLKEKSAPDGYAVDSNIYKVIYENGLIKQVISTDGNYTLETSTEDGIYFIKFSDEILSGSFEVNLYKYIKDSNNKPLNGAEFSVQIYNKDDENDVLYSAKKLTTDTNGNINIKDCKISGENKTYHVTITETKAPKNYVRISGTVEFDITTVRNGNKYGLNTTIQPTDSDAKNITIEPNNVIVKLEDDTVEIHKGVESVDNQNATYNGDDKQTWVIESKVPTGMKALNKYVITDKIDDRLVFLENSVNISTKDGKIVDKSNYKIEHNEKTLTITFIDNVHKNADDNFIAGRNLQEGSTLQITFNTTFAKDENGELKANILNELIPNQAKLTYDNGVNEEHTIESEIPKVHTGGIKVYKYETIDENKVPVVGAKFKIAKSKNDAEKKKFLTNKNGEEIIGISDKNGIVQFKGIKFGKNANEYENNKFATIDKITGAKVYCYDDKFNELSSNYYVVETEAPDGYIKYNNPIKITINANSYNTEISQMPSVENTERNFDIVINKEIYGEEKLKLQNAEMAIIKLEKDANGKNKYVWNESLVTNSDGNIVLNQAKIKEGIYEYMITETKTPGDEFVNVLKNKGILVYLKVNYDGSIEIVDKDGKTAKNKYYIYDISDKNNIKDITDKENLLKQCITVGTSINNEGKPVLNYNVINTQKYNFSLIKTDKDTKKAMNGVKFSLSVTDTSGKKVKLKNANTLEEINTKELETSNVDGQDGIISIKDILIEKEGTFTFTLHEKSTKGIFDFLYKEHAEDIEIKADIADYAGRYVIENVRVTNGGDYVNLLNINSSIKTEVVNERVKGKYNLIIDKIDSYTNKKLSGAEFNINVQKVDANGKYKDYVLYKATNDVTSKEQILPNNKVIADKDGRIKIENIRIEAKETYRIIFTETKASNGYMLLDDPIIIEVTTTTDGRFDDERFVLESYKIVSGENYGLVTINKDKSDNTKIFMEVKNEYFDLSLRKSITSVEYPDKEDSKITEDETKNRAPEVVTNDLLSDKSTTAIYNHDKNPVRAYNGQDVIYTLRVYNEGEIDGYAQEVTDHLPEWLEFVDDEFNRNNGWYLDENDLTNRTVRTTNLSKEYGISNGVDNLIKARDKVTGVLDYKEIQIKCRVSDDAKVKTVLTNIAEISLSKAENRTSETVDRDSVTNNVKVPDTAEGMSKYKDDELSKSYVPGQEDDDDFEKVIVEEFDLALRKYITAVNGEEMLRENQNTEDTNDSENSDDKENTNDNKNTEDKNSNETADSDDENSNIDDVKYAREPIVNVSALKDGSSTTATYVHTKEPVEVSVDDIVRYTISVYNEGTVSGYASLIKDDIPEGLEFVKDSEVNKEFRWKLVDENDEETDDVTKAKYIVSDYLSKENGDDNLLNAFNGTKLDTKYVQVEFRVICKQDYPKIIENQAQIADDTDESGKSVIDRDSTPNEWKGEDDEDVEYVKVTYMDLALRKFITGVNKEEVTSRIPQVDATALINETGTTATYTHPKDSVLVHTDDIVTYTIRVYNEGSKDGYATEVKDDIPESLEYLPDNEINQEYEWKLMDENDNEVTDLSKAKYIVTNYLSKENETKDRQNLMKAFDKETMTTPEYKDIKIAFRVTEPITSNRVLVNYAQISKQTDKKGIDRPDRDSTPNKWVKGEDDQDIENVRVQYFDLALRKWVTKAIVTQDGKTEVTPTGHQAEDNPEEVVKVDLKKSKINSVVVKFEYQIRVTNEGEVAGYAKEIKDRIPQGLKFDKADNPNWAEVKDGVITTNELQNTLLQPGESAEVTVILTWVNSETNMGVKVNVAEISEDYNDYGTPDIDSTPNNNVSGEDDIDDAPVMLTVKTGVQDFKYILICLGVFAILALGVNSIKKNIKK